MFERGWISVYWHVMGDASHLKDTIEEGQSI